MIVEADGNLARAVNDVPGISRADNDCAAVVCIFESCCEVVSVPANGAFCHDDVLAQGSALSGPCSVDLCCLATITLASTKGSNVIARDPCTVHADLCQGFPMTTDIV